MTEEASAGTGESEFTFLGFDGGRFTSRGFPLSAASELELYQAALTEIGRDQWLQTHQANTRFTPRLKEELELRFVSTNPGSVYPVAIPNLPGLDQISNSRLDLALTRLYEIVNYVATNGTFPAGVNKKVRSAFVRIGQGLRPKESLKFSAPSQKAEIKYTYETRKNFLATLKAGSSKTGSLLGSIVEIYPDKSTFKLKLVSGLVVDGKLSHQSIVSLMRNLVSTPLERSVVRLEASYEVDGFERIKSISDIEKVEEFLVATDPWTPRLTELLSLKDGWFDGVGQAINTDVVEFTRLALNAIRNSSSCLPRIFPTPSGGIQLERYDQDQHLELIINSDLSVDAFYSRESDSVEIEAALSTPELAAEFVGKWI